MALDINHNSEKIVETEGIGKEFNGVWVLENTDLILVQKVHM